MNEDQKMPVFEGRADGRGLRVRIVAAKYNRAVVDALVEGALRTLREHGVADETVQLVRVPGAFEIPLALARGGAAFDAQIALGCVIRGETAHFDQVVSQCGRGVMDVSLQLGRPIGFGVLAVANIEQAHARSGETSNRGEEATLAALEMAGLLLGSLSSS